MQEVESHRRRWSPRLGSPLRRRSPYATLTISPSTDTPVEEDEPKENTPLNDSQNGRKSDFVDETYNKTKGSPSKSRFGFFSRSSPRARIDEWDDHNQEDEMKTELSLSPVQQPRISTKADHVEMIIGSSDDYAYFDEYNTTEGRDDHARSGTSLSKRDGRSSNWCGSTITSRTPAIAPTELHELCLNMCTKEDLLKVRSILRAPTSHDGSVYTSASKTDDRGRTPLHLFSSNKALPSSLGGRPFGYNQEARDYLQRHHRPFLDEESIFEQQIIRFLVGELLPACPSAMLIRDSNGFIPFEAALVDWVDYCHAYGMTRREPRDSSKLSSLVQVWESTSSTVRSAVRLAGRHVSKATNYAGHEGTEITSQQDSQDPEVGEDSLVGRRLDADNSCSNLNSTIQPTEETERTMKSGSFPPNVRLTTNVRFVLVMLSEIVDQLDRYMSPEKYKKSLKKGHQDAFKKASRELRTFRELYGTIDISATVVQIMASIPELMKTILLIDDEEDRDFALSTSIVRRMMINDCSVGRWLTSMLQSKDRKMAQRVVAYLKLVSDTAGGARQGKHESMTRLTPGTVNCDDLINEISRLEDFVPALLALGDRGIEEASSSLVVQRVLDRMISRPFAVTVVFCDVVFLALLIVGFRSAVNQLIVGGSINSLLQWIYVANTGIFYFLIREIGKTVSLCLIKKQSRIYFLSFWNLIDMLATGLALASTILIRYHFALMDRGLEDAPFLRRFLAVTTGVLWLRVLSLLKAINMQLATFVLAILQITGDILWFCVILLTMVVSFAQMFYTLMAPPSCANNAETATCSQTEFLLNTYTVLLGDFGNFRREEFSSGFSTFLIVLYSFLVTVILLNVLIAVASDSYEKCLVRSENLFGRARVMLIAELASFQNLLRKTDQSQDRLTLSTRIYSKWWSSRPWNQDWSRGSVLFFSLSLVVILAWIVGETVGYASRERSGDVILSLASIMVNLVLFIAIITFLASNSAHSGSKKEPYDEVDDELSTSYTVGWRNGFIQKVMLRILGTSSDGYLKSTGSDEWNGRVHYLHREMKRIAEESSTLLNEQSKGMENLVKISESRLRTQMLTIERSFEFLKQDVMREIMGTKETNALVATAAEELKTLIAMTSSGSDFRSPVPSVLDINDARFVRHDSEVRESRKGK